MFLFYLLILSISINCTKLNERGQEYRLLQKITQVSTLLGISNLVLLNISLLIFKVIISPCILESYRTHNYVFSLCIFLQPVLCCYQKDSFEN